MLSTTIFLNDDDNEESFPFQCDRLFRNDPDIIKVDAAYEDISSTDPMLGYGRPLGQALLPNTVVNHIVLNPSTFFTAGVSHPQDEATPMLDYIRSSPALRTVTLRNGYSVQAEENRTLTNSIVEQILDATTQNPGIECIEMRVEVQPDDFARFLETTKVRTLDLTDPVFWNAFHVGDESTRHVAEAFGSNRMLAELSLLTIETTDFAVEQILRQLGRHLTLRKLTLCAHVGQRFCTELKGLSSLVRATSVLETLILQHVGIDLEHAVHLMDGLASCGTLARLNLHFCTFTSEAAQRLIAFVQTKANRGSSGLCELRMGVYQHITRVGETFGGMTVGQVIPEMLKGAALKRFRMYGDYGECNARQLLDTVRQNGSLVEVFVNQGPNGFSIFNEDEAIRVTTYCERNAKLPPLLMGHCESSVNRSRSNAAMIPLLFAVTQRQAPEVTIKTILIGVLTNDCIGPHKLSSKRRFP
jgi:hypothetical protein